VVVKQLNLRACLYKPWKFRQAVAELRNEIWARKVLAGSANGLGFHVPAILSQRVYLWGLLPVSLEMEYCDGRPLADLLIEGGEDCLGGLLAGALRSLSRIEAKPELRELVRDCAWYGRLLAQAKGRRAEVLRSLHAFVAALRGGHNAMMHGDLYPRNILVRKEHPRLVILDWGGARFTRAWQGYDFVWLFSMEKVRRAGLRNDARACWEGVPGSQESTLDFLAALRSWVRCGRTVEGNPWKL
jgi:serine/threonine protein kinase